MKLVEYDLKQFTNETFSSSPVPGGGGVSSLASSLGTALGGMVLNLTIGKEQYKQYEDELKNIINSLEGLKDEFLEFVDKDSESFMPLAKAYKLPSETEEEIKYKKEVIQQATKNACEVPAQVVKKSYEAIRLLEKLLGKTTHLAVTDIAVGMILLRAGLVGSWMNVLINLSAIDDEEYITKVRNELECMMRDGIKICDRVCDEIETMLEEETGGKNG